MDLIASIHDRLADDLPLRALLADYRGQPAIFAEARAPADARPPWLLLVGPLADEPEDAAGLRLRRLRIELLCAGDARVSRSPLDAIAARVRALLHAVELEPDGAVVLAQSCAGPTAPEADRSFLLRRLELRLLLNEAAAEEEES